ncbi:MAG: acyltransferase family protein, partial [Devosia sp.]|nr:acyltransferase family protein [Devosia sp.]
MNDKEYFPNFDWFRLLLAIEVVAVHSGVGNFLPVNPVPGFIAISGFVVMGSLERRPPLHFVASRALRVLPLLFVMFGYIGFRYGFDEMVKNVRYWLWPPGNELPLNPVVWSLIYEEFCYALLLVLGLVGAYRWRWLSLVFTALCAGGVLTSSRWWPPVPPELCLLGGAFFLGNAMYLYRAALRRVHPAIAGVVAALAFSWTFAVPYTSIVRPAVLLQDYLS